MLKFKKLGMIAAFMGLMLAFGTSAQAQVLGTSSLPEVTIYVEKNSDDKAFDTFKIFATASDVGGYIKWIKVFIDNEYVATSESGEYTKYFDAYDRHSVMVITKDNDGNLAVEQVSFAKD